MEDLRLFSMHYYYRVEDSDMFCGEDGYVSSDINYAKNYPDLEEDKKIEQRHKEAFSGMLEVPIENIIRISREEYLENTDEDL